MTLFTGKKLLLLGFIVALLATIPLTVFFLRQQTRETTIAAPATTLSFNPASKSATAGETIPLDIMMDPGTNQVSFVKLHITYDPTKVATAAAGTACPGDGATEAICSNLSAFPAILEGPIYSSGSILLTLSVGADPTKVIQTATKIATVYLKGIAATGSTATPVTFGTQTQVLSIASGDQPSENVLSTKNPASLTITGTLATPTPTISPTAAVNQPPVCTSLNVDRTTSGVAPFSITFTANGNDPDGTINKITFNFGDGPVQDITQGSGIGTTSISAQIAHTYNNAGTFTASALLTDNRGGVSTTGTCTQTITVSQTASGSGQTGGAVAVTTPTPSVTNTTPTIQPTIAATGPSHLLFGAGTLGVVLSIIGVLLFLAL